MYLRFLKLNPRVRLFILLEAIYNSPSKKNLPFIIAPKKGMRICMFSYRVYEIDTQKNGIFTQTYHFFEAVNYHTKK